MWTVEAGVRYNNVLTPSPTGKPPWSIASATAMIIVLRPDSTEPQIDHILERIREILRKAGLPTTAPRIGAARALELMQKDKKVLAGTVRLVLLERLGRAIVTGDYSQAALDAAVAAHFE